MSDFTITEHIGFEWVKPIIVMPMQFNVSPHVDKVAIETNHGVLILAKVYRVINEVGYGALSYVAVKPDELKTES